MIKIFDNEGTAVFGFTMKDLLEMAENPRTIEVPGEGFEIKTIIFTIGESNESMKAGIMGEQKLDG